MHLHSGLETPLDIFPSIIDVEDLLWGSAGLDDGSPVDDRVGLAGTHSTGIDPGSEVAGETEVCFQVGYVDGIRIERAVPCRAELLKCGCGPQVASEMLVPFARLDPPFLPLTPPWIGFDRGPDSLGREVGAGPKHGQSAFQVDAHDYAPDVKNDCFNSLLGLRSLRACAGELGHG